MLTPISRAGKPRAPVGLMICVALCLLLTARGHALPAAQVTPASVWFQQASQAMERGDYNLAASLFANIAGSPSPQVHFNLGQVYLKLGQLGKARQSFLALAAQPRWQALAWFYLANICQRQQQDSQAFEYYQKIIELNNHPVLVSKSQRYLALLSAVAPKEPPPSAQHETQFIAELALISASNPLGTAAAKEASTSDQAWQGWLWAGRTLTDALSLSVQISKQDYDKNADLDLTFAAIAVDYRLASGHRLGVSLNNVHGDAIGYQQSSFYLKKSWFLAATELGAEINMSAFQADDKFAYLSGTRVGLHGYASQDMFAGRVGGRYQLYKDQRQDLITDDVSTRYSPLKQRLTGSYERALYGRWQLSATAWWFYHKWPAETIKGRSQSSARTARGSGVAVRVTRRLALATSASLNMRREDNPSDHYQNTELSISLQHSWY